MFGVLGNLIVISIRVSKGRMNSHVLLVICLALADILMVIYLIILAIADSYIQGNFAYMATEWSSGFTCMMTAFLFTSALELDVMFSFALTIEHFLLVVHPFQGRGLDTNNIKLMLVLLPILIVIISVTVCCVYTLPTHICMFLFPSSVDATLNIKPAIVFSAANMTIGLSSCLFYMAILVKTNRTRIQASRLVSNRDREYQARVLAVCFINMLTNFCPFIANVWVNLGRTVNYSMLHSSGVAIVTINSIMNPFLYTLSTREYRQIMVTKLSRGLAK